MTTTNTTATPNTNPAPIGKLEVEKGRLGANPDFYVSEKGTLVVRFSIANRTGKYFKDPKSGLPVERVTWTDCVVFGPAGKFVLDTCVKGDFVILHGRWQERETKDCNGLPKTQTEFVVKFTEAPGRKADPTTVILSQDQDDELAALGDVIRS